MPVHETRPDRGGTVTPPVAGRVSWSTTGEIVFQPAPPRRTSSIIGQVRAMIEDGRLRPGDRLPSVRADLRPDDLLTCTNVLVDR